MKLYIKQKAFSIIDQFTICDIEGNARYYVEEDVCSFAKLLHIHSMDGEELMSIRRKLWSFLPTFHVYKGAVEDGAEIAKVVKQFSLFVPSYRIDGPNWTVEGDVFAYDYTIMQEDAVIATVSKKWLSWGDTYEIDCMPLADELLALAVVLVIDACLEAKND